MHLSAAKSLGAPFSAFHGYRRRSPPLDRTPTTKKKTMTTTTTASLLGTPLPQMLPSCAYLDYNATTPIFPEVADEMLPFLARHFGNPSSIHAYAKPCSDAIGLSRARVRKAIGAEKDAEVIFTSCGTESDNRARCSLTTLLCAQLLHYFRT